MCDCTYLNFPHLCSILQSKLICLKPSVINLGRKAHLVIGFQELSRLISQRWATLDTRDSETKAYVTSIAARELEEYKLEVKEYKKLIMALHTTTTNTTPASNYVLDDKCGGDTANDVRLLLAVSSTDVTSSSTVAVSVQQKQKQPRKVTRLVSEPEND